MSITKDSYTIGDVARHFGVTTQTIRNWASAGYIPEPVRNPANDRREYDEGDLLSIQEYIDSK